MRSDSRKPSHRDFELPEAEQEEMEETPVEPGARLCMFLCLCAVCSFAAGSTWLFRTRSEAKAEEPFAKSSRWTRNADERLSYHWKASTAMTNEAPEPTPETKTRVAARVTPNEKNEPPSLPPSPYTPPPRSHSPIPPLSQPSPSPPPSLSTASAAVDKINARFGRSPFIDWPADGQLADAGVLIHCFDDWEDKAHPWAPSSAHLQRGGSCSARGAHVVGT